MRAGTAVENMQLTLGEVAGALGTASEMPDRLAEGYSIDSRTVSKGQLFFAIRGPRFDGHDFVTQAFEGGTVGAVVAEEFWRVSPVDLRAFLLPVPDTTRALQQLGHWIRKKWGSPLVAITGSAGKSTTKEMAAAILGRRFRVQKSQGNLNNHIGLPLTLLEIEPEHEVAVAELAMSAAGEIALLTRLAAPDVGVVTNVAAAHLEFFDSVESIALAKKELVDNLPAGATTVLNYDDAIVREFDRGFNGRTLTFGWGKGADLRALEIRADPDRGCRFRVQSQLLEGEFYLPLPGRHNVQNALAAMTAAAALGASGEDVREALKNFQPLPQRSEILTLPSGVVLISDCYNSNPLAMEKMLETLANWPGAKRRIVVAGEMLELGPAAPTFHHAIGRKAHEAGVDWLVAVRGNARFLVEGAVEAGLKPDRAQFFATPEESVAYCRALLQPGDVVLVKGSRAVQLDKVVDSLKSSGTATDGSPSGGSAG